MPRNDGFFLFLPPSLPLFKWHPLIASACWPLLRSRRTPLPRGPRPSAPVTISGVVTRVERPSQPPLSVLSSLNGSFPQSVSDSWAVGQALHLGSLWPALSVSPAHARCVSGQAPRALPLVPGRGPLCQEVGFPSFSWNLEINDENSYLEGT